VAAIRPAAVSAVAGAPAVAPAWAVAAAAAAAETALLVPSAAVAAADASVTITLGWITTATGVPAGSTGVGVAVLSSLLFLVLPGLSVDLLPSDFTVPEEVSDLVSALLSLSDPVFDLASLCAVGYDGAAFVALLSLVELLFEEVVLVLRDESELDELVLLLERCDGVCCVGGGEKEEEAGSAWVAASTIAAKLSPSCEESGWADFGAVA
jgi:hypothetical protein